LLALILSLVIPVAALAQPAAAPHVMPPLDRPWTATDYAMAVEMIADQEVPLPLFTTETRTVLDRFLARENLKPLRDAAVPVETRLRSVASINQSTGRLYNVYIEAARQRKLVHVELAQLIVLMMDTTTIQGTLIDQLVAGGRSINPQQQAGMARMYAGFYGSIADSVSDKKVFTTTDCSMLLGSASRYYPKVVHYLDDAQRAQMRQKFQALHDQAKAPGDIANLDKLLAVE
jgi:hypothetical protein